MITTEKKAFFFFWFSLFFTPIPDDVENLTKNVFGFWFSMPPIRNWTNDFLLFGGDVEGKPPSPYYLQQA